MNRYMTKYFALSGALLLLAALSGCQLDDPGIPSEELYIRNFIKQYGLVDPSQDFSSAVQTTVTLEFPAKASLVNVYAQMGDDFYRVGCFANLQGTVKLPLDVSEATETLMVDVDGVRYYTVPGGVLTVKSVNDASNPASRAVRTMGDDEIKSLWIDPANWAAVTSTNGETSDSYAPRQQIEIKEGGVLGGAVKNVSGVNYFNVATSAHIGANLNGDKSHKTTLGDNESATNPGEVANTYDGANVRFLIKNSDDALSAYRFVFRTAARNDAKVRVVLLGQHKNGSNDDGVYIFMDSHNLAVDGAIAHKDVLNTSTKDKYTEWELRTELMPRGYYELIIMGVESEANFDGDRTCGNWGYMWMERIKTAKDMKWILACEDLGTTDDFDFNDVVLSIEAVNTNMAAVKLGLIQWQVVDNTGHGGTVIRPASLPSRAGEGDADKFTTQVRVQALASGGMLPIWLHFREEEGNGTGTDYLVCPAYDDGMRGCLKEVSTIADAEVAAESSNATLSGCSEWHRWFGISSSAVMLNTGTHAHINNPASVTFYTKNVFTLENFCYLKFVTDSPEGLPYYFDEDTDLDPWAKKVLQWKWQQEHSQEVTFGFFITVYEPVVGGSQSHIISKSIEGLPPQMFLIPDCSPMRDAGKSGDDNGWQWPYERVDITWVYPNFTSWVQDAYGYSGINWFMLPKSGAGPYDLYPRDKASQEALTPVDPSTLSDN